MTAVKVIKKQKPVLKKSKIAKKDGLKRKYTRRKIVPYRFIDANDKKSNDAPASEHSAPQDDDSVMIIDPPTVRKLSNVTFFE